LWPLYLQNDPFRLGDVSSWEEADRKFTWLASVYTMAEKRLQRLNLQQEKLKANLEKRQRIRAKAASQVNEVKRTEDELLQQKLSYLHQLQKIRAKRLAKEEQLENIRDTIGELEYKLKLLSTRRIEHLKGHLPWPVRGDVIARFDPKADPPQEGIGLKVSEGSEVEAVCWGKVVYDDTLRGFGRVVIIFHGNNYYTLYAYLNRSSVRMGQDVEKGEPIGEAGYYPQAQGTGLYFELRSGKHPIDPGPWLGKPA
jgi:septal ring factor EnvC (AmiA/AmiB activator)